MAMIHGEGAADAQGHGGAASFGGRGGGRAGPLGAGKGHTASELHGKGAAAATGRGRGVGKGRGWKLPAIDPRTVFHYSPPLGVARVLPALVTNESVICCSEGDTHTAVLCLSGAILDGQTDAGDTESTLSFPPVHLPWRAAAVSSGTHFAVAHGRGAAPAVCSWGAYVLGRPCGDVHRPSVVEGLPHGDPIVLLEAGPAFAVAATASGEVWVWGETEGLLPGKLTTRKAERVEQLSGRGVRRLACGSCTVVAETCGGELLRFGLQYVAGSFERRECQLKGLQPHTGSVAFPLRSLAAGVTVRAAAADAAGQLWLLWSERSMLGRSGLPRTEIVVRAAVAGANCCVVALTAAGCLWDCRATAPCRVITTMNYTGYGRTRVRGLPAGLLPYGGSSARGVMLLPDLSCGLRRCRLLLLAAVVRCKTLPGGQMLHTALAPFLVDADMIIHVQVDVRAAAQLRQAGPPSGACPVTAGAACPTPTRGCTH
eukprot:TRINITY_DN29693_c0_g1_i3.p1 TRINITY_DN29693_c0_g1~~TRINITY_DN29693_c0_g1_i3.p1  ORF type:complete len:540 (+),score=50.28 TRINITY_DN29693_c0_g1_i3:168-1622(+)